MCLDHVHRLIRIPPKYSVSQVVGYIQGKSALRGARDFMGRHRNDKGYHFWARGYFVSTVELMKRRFAKPFATKKRMTKRLTNGVCFSTLSN